MWESEAADPVGVRSSVTRPDDDKRNSKSLRRSRRYRCKRGWCSIVSRHLLLLATVTTNNETNQGRRRQLRRQTFGGGGGGARKGARSPPHNVVFSFLAFGRCFLSFFLGLLYFLTQTFDNFYVDPLSLFMFFFSGCLLLNFKIQLKYTSR